MRSYITSLMLLATLGLVSCGGGNDVASSGASAVSAAASATTTTATASAPSTTTAATTTTEPKVNGQIDERTGVAPVVASMTLAHTVTACLASMTYGGTGPLLLYGSSGPLLGRTTAPTLAQCKAVLPFAWTVYSHGGCGASMSFFGGGPWLTNTQYNACAYVLGYELTNAECNALGGSFSPFFPQYIYGSCTVQNGPD
jgi:hypothetical protein